MLNILTWSPISVKIALLRYLLRRSCSVLPTPDEALQSIGATIRAARIARGHTQQSLAKEAKVSRGNLALLEQGGNVSIRYLLKIARVLELTDIPLGGTVQLTSGKEDGLNVFRLIESFDLLAVILDHLRHSVMNAVLPASERSELKDTVALKDFVTRHLGNSGGVERLAKAIVQLSDDVAAGASPPRVGEVEKNRTRSSRRTKVGR
jgi:transcriptional regulator with XRE-family HTH domain